MKTNCVKLTPFSSHRNIPWFHDSLPRLWQLEFSFHVRSWTNQPDRLFAVAFLSGRLAMKRSRPFPNEDWRWQGRRPIVKHTRACYMAWELVMRPNTDCAVCAPQSGPKRDIHSKAKAGRTAHRLLAFENTRQLGHAHSQKLVRPFDWLRNGIENAYMGMLVVRGHQGWDLDSQRKLNAFEFIAFSLYTFTKSHTERSVCRDD